MKYYIFCVALLFSIALNAQKGKAKSKPTIQQADSLFLARDWNAAIPIYEAVLKKEPDNSLAWNRLGFSYHNLSNYDKALLNYSKSLEYKPTPAIETIVQSRMARVYSVKSENDRAFQSLDRALQLGYANLSELDTQKEFDNIRSDSRFTEVVKRANVNAYPCMGNAQARQFDFWIGEWDAFVRGTNNLAGHSKIEMASGGCMILENWTSVGAPFSGKSMNFVDPVSGKWKQIWVGSGATPNASEFLNGEYRDGAMRFEFETRNPQGGKQLVHFYFFNEGPDQVRQFHEVSNDAGKTWTTTYDFTYKRKQ
ncbi:MAG TPA: tetratricopeptide repeat protein [Cyclobacteriaceae bacterium]|nr:tetratricopeptide repeat protein [Cyclobacteriaceae bacterium]